MVKESFSIKSTAEFQAVFAQKCSASDGLLIVYGRLNGRAASRLGLSVSKRYGGAVLRVRWKRLVREAFRRTVSQQAASPQAASQQAASQQAVSPQAVSPQAVSRQDVSRQITPSMDFVVVPGKLRRSDFMPDFQESLQKLLPTVAKKLKRAIISHQINQE